MVYMVGIAWLHFAETPGVVANDTVDLAQGVTAKVTETGAVACLQFAIGCRWATKLIDSVGTLLSKP